MKKFCFLLFIFAFLSFFGFQENIRAEMQKCVMNFDDYSDELNADAAKYGSANGWSWNNVNRTYSGFAPGGDESIYHVLKTYETSVEGVFEIEDFRFMNNYSSTYSDGEYWYSWEGFGISNVNDKTQNKYENEMASVTGTGAGGSDVYGIMYIGMEGASWLEFPKNAIVDGMMICNTAYAYGAMKDGNYYCTALGDSSDGTYRYFDLVINGYDKDGNFVASVSEPLGEKIRSYDENMEDELFLPDYWFWLDLSELGAKGAVKYEFSFDSNEASAWGLNYPTYFAFDDLTYYLDDGIATTPEPATALIMGVGLFGLGAIGRRRFKKK